jgi:hypothetical protein
MEYSLKVWTLIALGVGICLFAFWKGDRAERIAGALILANLALSVAGDFVFGRAMPLVQLIGDGVTALGLLALALLYASLWLGGAMLLYAVQFSLHSYYFVSNRPVDILHAVINNFDFMGVLLCLAVGTAISARRRATRTQVQGAS